MRATKATINTSMIQPFRLIVIGSTLSVLALCLVALLGSQPVGALDALPTPEPVPGSYGLEATKTQDPPTAIATITTPVSGASFATSPVTVNGLCAEDLLVEIYNNGVMVGSVPCENGSFTLQVSLFAGTNEFTAIMYDNLEQASPVSNTVSVQYTDTQFSAFAELITLTSSYGRRSANAGAELTWPLQLTGGTGPYAFSVNWGDGGDAELISQPFTGVITIAHTYAKAGIYKVNVLVSDVNGVTAFLQLTAVANGQVDAVVAGAVEGTEDLATAFQSSLGSFWVPAATTAALLFPAFFLGRASEVVSLRKKVLRQRDSFNRK